MPRLPPAKSLRHAFLKALKWANGYPSISLIPCAASRPHAAPNFDDTLDATGVGQAGQPMSAPPAPCGVTINLQVGTAGGDASVGHDTFTGVNSATGSNFADAFDASGLTAGLFSAFQGQGGDDAITGNGATQILFGNATSGVSINLAAGTASGDASTGHDTFTGVNSVVGGNFNDTFNATGFVGFNAFQGGR